ncbi:methyltransferase domain-containing protein [Hyaloraphidium curvatum]|nr:methyltransferase domain-containing protein [Hyaloraphidium curvatum]
MMNKTLLYSLLFGLLVVALLSPAARKGYFVKSGPSAGLGCARILVAREAESAEQRLLRRDAVEQYSTRKLSDKELYDPWEPDWTCGIERRIGRPIGDGGKWTCFRALARPGEPCLVYSVGSNYDFTFEASVRKHGQDCEIHTFDPTTDLETSRQRAEPLGVSFHPLFWGNQSVESIISSLNHTSRPRLDVLKIDCEGCEHQSGFLDFFRKCARSPSHTTALPVTQILIEVHGQSTFSRLQKLFEAFEMCGFRIFHKELNIWGGYGGAEYSLVSPEGARIGFWLDHCPNVPWDDFLKAVAEVEDLGTDREGLGR